MTKKNTNLETKMAKKTGKIRNKASEYGNSNKKNRIIKTRNKNKKQNTSDVVIEDTSSKNDYEKTDREPSENKVNVAEKVKTVKKKKRKLDLEDDVIDKYPLDKFINLNEVKLPLKCNSCDSTFNTSEDFVLHSKEHNEDGRYSCHLCDYKKKKKLSILQHIKGHDLFKCELCRKVFKRKRCAIKHSLMHATKKPFQCEICGKELSNNKNLRHHRQMVHLTGKPVIYQECTICHKKYKSVSSLRRHCSFNHKELGIDMSVICEICGKSISTKGGLLIHLRTHREKRPHACHLCSKTFVTRTFLNAHMVTHTGEKPYVCKFCGKRYGHGSAYRYHIRTHTGDRPYSCQFCGKGFITNANKKIHMKSCFKG
ncbi:zinc finger protein 239-like [Anoplophora glabripennis]|uniref:zinc finger protein 239-like n=1 Tax=Anoplophora glabripennis TaxID=217634 RepID=UPI000C761E14|nr:zinc finger protein 239-like [Anoplophora glabripennis]